MLQPISPSQNYALPARRGASVSRHMPAAVAYSIYLFIALWLVTRGTWRLMDAEDFGGFYDAQAQSLLDGHWDVPHAAVRPEAFIRDGKSYGYFGFIPALLRMPLIKLWPPTAGHWSRVSILIGCFLGVVYAHLLLLRMGAWLPRREADGNGTNDVPKFAEAIFILVAGLGSTTILLPSRAFPNHEALAWGAAFSIASFYHLIGFLIRPRSEAVIAAAFFALAAFFSRASVGAGPILALALLATNIVASRWSAHSAKRSAARLITSPGVAINPWINPPARSAATMCLFTVILTCGLYTGVNYAKFRTFFEAAPLRNYEQMFSHPDRLERTGGKVMSLRNVRTTAFNYFRPDAARIGQNFPWVYASEEANVFPEARLDLVEPYSSFTLSMPALLVLSLLGLVSLRKSIGLRGSRLTIPLLGALAGGLTVLSADAVSQRYLHDFFPFLIVSGAAGFHRMLGIQKRLLRRAMWDAWVLLAALSIWLNLTFAITYQRVIIWGVDQKARLAFWETAVSVDNVISRRIWHDVQPPPRP